jgi:hypothetical protein
MAQNSILDLKCKIEALSFFFNFFEELNALNIVKIRTDSRLLAQFGKVRFTVVPEGTMPDVVSQSDCLDQVFVETQKSSDGPGYLGYKLNMEDSVGDMVIIHEVEDLSLVYISCVCKGVENSVRVNRIILPMPFVYPVLGESTNGVFGVTGRG